MKSVNSENTGMETVQGISIGREAVYLQRMTLLLKSTARTLIRRYSSLLIRTGEEKSHGVFQE